MATINSLTSATIINPTDQFLIETISGPLKLSGAVLKEKVTADSQKKGRVIWEDTPATSINGLELKHDKIYAFYVEAFTVEPGHYQIVYAQALGNSPVRIEAGFSYAYLDVDYQRQYSGGLIEGVYALGAGTIDINSKHSIKVSKIIEYDEV